MLITLNQAAQKIKNANKILITSHIQPDGDAIGSSLATFQIIRALGKSAHVFIDEYRRHIKAHKAGVDGVARLNE